MKTLAFKKFNSPESPGRCRLRRDALMRRISVRRFRQLNQAWQQTKELGALRLAEGKINLAVKRVELVVNGLRRNLRVKHSILRADSVLRFLYGLENARGEKGKNGRTQADHIIRGNEHGPAQHICIHLIQDIVFLGNPAGVDDTPDDDAVLFHAIENDSRVQCSAFDGGEEFVPRGGLQIPAEGNATQVWIYQNRAVAVVPGDA